MPGTIHCATPNQKGEVHDNAHATDLHHQLQTAGYTVTREGKGDWTE